MATTFPESRVPQEALTAALAEAWADHPNFRRVEAIHAATTVRSRHMALPLERYLALRDFGEANDAWAEVGAELGVAAVRAALERASIAPDAVDALWFTTVTGLAVPSLEVRVARRLGMRPDVKRVPLFGLGCVAGAAGLARAADYVRAWPNHVAVLLSVELCSLTMQLDDRSVANTIATGLFGDGAAAVVLAGAQRAAAGPRVVATRSVLFPAGTEGVMGWRIGPHGFGLLLTAEVPAMVRGRLGDDVGAFLAAHGLAFGDVGAWICHPGGPKVMDAVEEVFGLGPDALARSRASLRDVGNLSSASVLHVLEATLAAPPPPGGWGLLLALGPGFCAELVLIRWDDTE